MSDSEHISENVNQPIFQSSTIDALLAGRYDGGFTIGEAKKHGDFGIGTFNALDGELVALDGNFYQVKTDGIPILLSDSIQTPFITLDFFTGNDYVQIGKGLDFAALSALLDDRIEKIHNMIAIKIMMTFDSLILRSVPKQNPPYRPLVEVVGNQVFFKHYNISGTMVGFRFPDYLEGVNVPGYHFHFLSDDLKHGGHILNFSTIGGNAYIDSESEFYLSIPQDESFQSQNLAIDRTNELKKVESDN
jgi:acetolactate decarboxylase